MGLLNADLFPHSLFVYDNIPFVVRSAIAIVETAAKRDSISWCVSTKQTLKTKPVRTFGIAISSM